jgi:small subunit ribosomal protein S17
MAEQELITKSKTGRRRLVGEIVKMSTPMMPVVKVSVRFAHPMYKRVVETWKNYHAHSTMELEEGDIVVIEEIKAISKTKKWQVIKKIEKKH